MLFLNPPKRKGRSNVAARKRKRRSSVRRRRRKLAGAALAAHNKKVGKSARRASSGKRRRRRKLHRARRTITVQRGGSMARHKKRRRVARRKGRRLHRNPGFSLGGGGGIVKRTLNLVKQAAPEAGAMLAGEVVSEFVAQKIPFTPSGSIAADTVHAGKKVLAGIAVAQFVIPQKYKTAFAAGVLASTLRGLLKARVASLAPYLGDAVVYMPASRGGSLSPSLSPGYGTYGTYSDAASRAVGAGAS